MMKDSAGKTIYVGKAKIFKTACARILQKNARDYKTQKLVRIKIGRFEFVVTDKEDFARHLS